MAGLAVTAPPTLAPDVLVEVGLADRYGPPRHRRSGRCTWPGTGRGVSGRGVAPEFAASHAARTGRPAFPADALPGRLARARSTRRLAGDRRVAHRPRPARSQRVRAGRLAQGPRDPARRGPAVRLDRRRDRPPEGGPGGRHGARPQPGAAHRAVPPGRPDGRHDRPVLAGRAGEQADDPGRRGPRPRRDGGRRAARRAAHRLRTRRTSCAGRPAGPGATCSTRNRRAVPLARRGGRRPATGRARCAGPCRGPSPPEPAPAGAPLPSGLRPFVCANRDATLGAPAPA